MPNSMTLVLLVLAATTAAFENAALGRSSVRNEAAPKAAEADRAVYRSVETVEEVVDTSSDETGTLSYTIEHAVLPGQWVPRGTVEITYSSQKQGGVVKFGPATLSVEEQTALQRNLASGYYSVRLRPMGGAAPGQAVVGASVRACQLVASGFRELFVFHSDVYGRVAGLDYRTPTVDCPNPARVATPSQPVPVLSKARTSFGRNGERPKQLERLQQPDPALSKEEEPQANQGFISRYWMYLLPAAIFMLISNASAGPKGN